MRLFNHFFLALLLTFVCMFSGSIYAQSTGSISGTVTDDGDNTPIVGAIIKIEGTNRGAETDVNGDYTFLNLEPGLYSLVASYSGYQANKQTGIKVSVDQKTKVNFLMSNNTKTDTIEIVVQRRGIDNEQSGRLITSESIDKEGIRGIQNIAAKTSGVVQDERGGNLNIRGGRVTDNLIIVDGVPTNNPITGTSSAYVPNSLLQEISVLTGGFGAEYGNALSGVINVTTKGGTSKYSGSTEIISDFGAGSDILGTTSQGYNLYNISLGGPLIPTKGLSKVINFYGGVERQYLQVRNPSYIAETLFDKGVIPDFSQKLWSVTGKMNINLQEIKKSKIPINLRLGGLYTQDIGQRFVTSYLKLNSFRNPIQEINNTQYYARLSHNVTTKLFYELQGTYYRSQDELSDAFFRDQWFAYGDTNQVPGLTNQGTGLIAANSTSGVFASPYTVFNRYTLYDISYVGGNLDATWAINTKTAGDHELKFGGNYQYNTLKKIDFGPVAVSNNPVDTVINGQIITANPDPQSLWFGRDVLLNSYGYDIRDQYGRQIVSNADIDPKHPIVASAYLRDKIDFKDFNTNLGIRMDYLDVNSLVLKDPMVLIDEDGVLLSDKVYEQSKANVIISPRLGFSFPITENTVFVANYGKFVQMPQLDYLYINRLAFEYFFKNSVQNVAENSALKPEQLTSYEIGAKQKIGDYIDMGLTVYYKETKEQIGITRIAGSSTVPSGYALYTNTDFSTSRGIDFYLSMRRTNRIALDIAYTLLYATGVGANPDAKFSLANNPNGTLPKFQFPLDYDQRHTGSVDVDFRFGGADDVPKGFAGEVLKYFGVNLLFSFNSGRPYTARQLPGSPFLDDGEATTSKNQVYRNWNLRFDLKVDKGFSIWRTRWDAYIYVLNLFNNELVNNVYGSTGRPDDNGYLLTPTGNASSELYKENWNQRIKNIANWGTPRQVRFGLRMTF